MVHTNYGRLRVVGRSVTMFITRPNGNITTPNPNRSVRYKYDEAPMKDPYSKGVSGSGRSTYVAHVTHRAANDKDQRDYGISDLKVVKGIEE